MKKPVLNIMIFFLLLGGGCQKNKSDRITKVSELDLPVVPKGIPKKKDLAFRLENPSDSVPASKRKNLLFILADDLGMGDLACYGNKKMHTPNIDRLAEQGIMLTNMHSASSVCSPSRAAILSGHFPMRYDYRNHFYDTGYTYMADSIYTLADHFSANGYFTSHIGKWHLGGLTPSDIRKRVKGDSTTPGPFEAGFQHYLGGFEDQKLHWTLAENNVYYSESWRYTLRNDSLLPLERSHLSELKTQEAIRVMQACQEKEQPFFLNLWMDIPHMPYEPLESDLYDHYKEVGYDGEFIDAKVMISKMDEEVGKLIAFLEESGLMEETLVVFTSDNGPTFGGSSLAYHGGKGTMYEGGILVPCIIYGLENEVEIQERSQCLNFVDFFPSFSDYLDLKGTQELSLDGLNFFDPKNDFKTRVLYYQTKIYPYLGPYGTKGFLPDSSNIAVTKYGYKLIMLNQEVKGLYNLMEDPFERKNLLKSHYIYATELQYEFRKFELETYKTRKKYREMLARKKRKS